MGLKSGPGSSGGAAGGEHEDGKLAPSAASLDSAELHMLVALAGLVRACMRLHGAMQGGQAGARDAAAEGAEGGAAGTKEKQRKKRKLAQEGSKDAGTGAAGGSAVGQAGAASGLQASQAMFGFAALLAAVQVGSWNNTAPIETLER